MTVSCLAILSATLKLKAAHGQYAVNALDVSPDGRKIVTVSGQYSVGTGRSGQKIGGGIKMWGLSYPVPYNGTEHNLSGVGAIEPANTK